MLLSSAFRLRSLKSRLAVWVVLPAAIMAAVDMLVAYTTSDQVATLVQQQLLHGAAAMISEQLVVHDDEFSISVPPAAFELLRTRSRDRVFFAIHAPDGTLIAGDEQLPPFAGEFGAEGETFFLSARRGERVRVIAYSYAIPNSSRNETVITQVAQTLRHHEEFRSALWQSSIRRHLFLIAAVLVFMAFALRWMLKPLDHLSDALTARQPGSLERVDEQQAPTELGPVIRSINDYVGRLDQTLSAYEKFVANTAHHLRNAFAIIGTQLNYAQRSAPADTVPPEVLGAVQRTLGKCTRVINQLLMLASLDQLRKIVPPEHSTPLFPVVLEVIEECAPLAQQRGVELGIETFDESMAVQAPKRLIREILTNLVSNAIQHMHKPGQVTISVLHTADEAILSVVDNGVGIPEPLRGKVFERFFRGDESSPDGSGLGMAIVKEVCDSLGARVTLDTGPGGEGLRVDVGFRSSGGRGDGYSPSAT